MTAVKRPLEVTIVAWFMLVAVVVKLFSYTVLILSSEVQETFFALGFHESKQALVKFPLSIHFVVSGIGCIVFLAAGVGLLRARHWGRITFGLWSGWALLFAFLTTGSLGYVTPKLLVYIVMMAILFSPRANSYFRTG